MARFRRILCATDFSSTSRAAFTRALALAKADRAQLTLVHVIAPLVPYVGEAYAIPQTYAQMLGSVRAEARKQISRLIARARAARVRARPLVIEGIPHDRIVRAARSARADLIVIGTSGRTGLARLLLGSVAARVIATAPCPVLTVRGR